MATSISPTVALFRAEGETNLQLEIGDRRDRRVEEVNDGRRCILLPLTTDICNESYPPMVLVNSQIPISHSELFWLVGPASASILFRITFPLSVGPLPYASEDATIRYFITKSQVRVGGAKHHQANA
jgi:hypothetical protein